MKIDEEFKNLIPPLTEDERKGLEESILKEGVRDSLIVWDNKGEFVLVDGHNRYEIATAHNLPYNIKRKEFDSRNDVIEWIILNQFGRRNINNYVRSELALRLKANIAARAKENQKAGGNKSEMGRQNSAQPLKTRDELAKVAGVSHDTIHKVEVIQQKASPEAKEALKRGETSINAVYSGIKADENETRKQEQARELREAKQRHKDFTEQKNESIVNLTEVKQDKEDSKMLFEELKKEFYQASEKMQNIGSLIERGIFAERIADADKWDLRGMFEKAQNWHSVSLRTMRLLEEAINEK